SSLSRTRSGENARESCTDHRRRKDEQAAACCRHSIDWKTLQHVGVRARRRHTASRGKTMTPTDWAGKSDNELNEIADAGLRGQGALGETNRRLREAIVGMKEAIHAEEVAIKRLTVWLVIMTAALVLLGGVDIWHKTYGAESSQAHTDAK